MSIDWTSNHDPLCLFELGGRHRLKDISCEESAWCWDFIRWTFEKKSTSAALHIDLELKTKWTFAQLEFRDTASEDFFFNVTVCKLGEVFLLCKCVSVHYPSITTEYTLTASM